jgi:hypothetical protein
LFFREGLALLLGWPWTEILLPLPPKQLGLHPGASLEILTLELCFAYRVMDLIFAPEIFITLRIFF